MLFSLQSQSTQKQCTSASSQLPSLSSRLPSPATNRPTRPPPYKKSKTTFSLPPSFSCPYLAPEKDFHSSVAPKWPSPCMIRAKGGREKKIRNQPVQPLHIPQSSPAKTPLAAAARQRPERGCQGASSSGSTNFAWPLGASQPAIDCSEQVRLGV